MIDLTQYTDYQLIAYINGLLNRGTTNALGDIPLLFKIGGGFDSESTTITKDVLSHKTKSGKEVYKTVVSNCFNYAYQFSLTPEDFAIFRHAEDFLHFFDILLNCVQQYNKLHNTNAIFLIWCANLAHEWAFIKSDLVKYNITRCFAKTSRDVLYVNIDNCIEFRECIGLFGHSLRDIAKNWCNAENQKEDNFNYDLCRHAETPLTEIEKTYMIHDVTTLSEMHQNVIKQYTQLNGVCRLPYTSSGFVRMALKESIRNDESLTELVEIKNEVRKHPYKNNIAYLKAQNSKLVLNPFQWHICREYSYAGGLCGTNLKLAGKILNDVVCADITSDYPAQLTQKSYPTGKLTELHGDLNAKRKQLNKEKKPYFAILKIKEMHAKTNHSTFSEHKIINKDGVFFRSHGLPKNLIVINGKVKHAENIIVCWNDVDIAAYKELYNIKAVVITLWAFSAYKRLPEWFINVLCTNYIDKAILKESGKSKTIEYADAKRNVNTLYGVCAQRIEDVFTAIDNDLNFTIEKEKTWKELKRSFWLNPYIAFWCTSYARALLMHFLARYPDSIVQYDTDSLYYLKGNGDGIEKALQEYNKTIENKNANIFRNVERPDIFRSLGTWDFDETYTKFLGMGAKKYIKQDKDGKLHTVIAGLPKNAIPAEIEKRGITQPFNYYNPLVKFVKEKSTQIRIEHIFAGKFASVYCDEWGKKYDMITDYLGNKYMQRSTSYHAILPIDFTLSMAKDYINYIIKSR